MLSRATIVWKKINKGADGEAGAEAGQRDCLSIASRGGSEDDVP